MLLKSMLILVFLVSSFSVFAKRRKAKVPLTRKECVRYLYSKKKLRKKMKWKRMVDAAKYAKNNCKKARLNDRADYYYRLPNGQLFQVLTKRKWHKKGWKHGKVLKRITCAVAGNIRSFKVSGHPGDLAMAYAVTKNRKKLYALNYPKADWKVTKCRKAQKTDLMAAGKHKGLVRTYTVTSNTNTKLVNFFLTTRGVLSGWTNTTQTFVRRGISEFKMNGCFGAKGKSFSSYVAFAKTRFGTILKIKGKNANSSKAEKKRRYASVAAFKKKRNVCK